MYVPKHFHEESKEVIQEIVEHYPLATLFVSANGKMSANHIPFLLDMEDDESYTLLGHIADNNEILKDFESGTDVMVVYRAEDTYVSPNWHPSKHVTHRHVPTWNYQAVHFYGKIEFVKNKKFLLNVVGRLTKIHEQRIGESKPWKISDAPADYIETLLDAITGVRIKVEKVIAKSKLSQNREKQDYDGVVEKVKELGKEFLYKQMINK